MVHCFTADLALFSRKDTERPESFLRRLLWKNSGVLCLATLISLPIILGVALGYAIVLAFVTTYRKITGKKSREEKESEAAKKFRIVLGHELLDTAFTKPEGLPGQKPKFARQLPRYGSINDASNLTLSSYGSESDDESESQETEDETIEQIDEKSLKENESEKEDLNKKVEACIEFDVRESQSAADYDGSRTTSASSGHYSTASEMIESDGRNSGKTDTPAQDTQEYDIQVHDTPEQNVYEKESLIKATHDTFQNKHHTVPDVTLQENGSVEKSASAVTAMRPGSEFFPKKSVPTKHSEIQLSGSQTHKATPSFSSLHVANHGDTAVKHDSSPTKLTSSHHIEISPLLGKLKYSVLYMRERNELQVTIIKAINLFHEKNESLPSSFVKVSLLPQRFCWQKTKVIHETRNPVFNETFIISGFSQERFSHYTLLICVVNAAVPWQGFYGDHVIGELHVSLGHVAKYSSNQEKVFSQSADLKEKLTEIPNLSKCGKINLALCYRPISGRLIVTIKKAKDLECESKEKFDPYVKLALFCGGSRVGRGNTRVKRKVINPVFNEKFNFDLSADQIAYTTIVVKLMNNIDSMNSTCTGATVLGYESTGNGQEHWLCMMKCLSKHVDAWHTLYS